MAAPLAALAAHLAAHQLRRGRGKDVAMVAGGGAGALLLTMTMISGGASEDPTESSCTVLPDAPVTAAPAAGGGEDAPGRGTFALPEPGAEVNHVKHTAAMPIPEYMKVQYVAAAKKYGIPWTLLAGIGMEETQHDRIKATSSAGAQGPMQWMPQYFPAYAQDGDGDGDKDILDPADAVHTTAYRLAKEGARKNPEGVRQALFSYNHATWYVNDVLTYAKAYGSGVITAGGGMSCGPSAGGDLNLACPAGVGQAGTGQLVGLNKGRPWLKDRIVQVGHQLKAMGLRVSEHPQFGGNHPEYHGKDSLHGYGLAIDVNGGETNGQFDKLAPQLWAQGFGVQWRSPNHDDHMHVDVGLLGRTFSYGPYVTNPNAHKLGSCVAPGTKAAAG